MPFYAACDYDEPDISSYRGIVLIDTDTNQIAFRFFSGDFSMDYLEYQAWLDEHEPYFFESDSIAQFVGDSHDPDLLC